jgi:phosphate transport system substrate-binding protein
VELLGAGASFPYPLYSKMFSDYNASTGVKINYQSIGSGGGIKQLMNKTVDFGASDAFLNDEDISKMPATVVHVPTCLGAAVVTYNISGDPTLKFTPDVIVDIFLGKITNWKDTRIKQLNPTVKLPDMPISIVHRSDGSGTTFIFTDYLSKVSEDWKNKVGHKTSVDWPAGLGAKGNEGVSGMIKQTPGAIGYVELIYALQNKMPVGVLKNKSGKFIEANIKSVTSAANQAIPADARVSITNTDAPDGYPISSFTWILLYKEQNYDNRPEDKAKEVVKLVWWMTHEGQQFAAPLMYAPLPKEALKVVEANLKSIVFSGKSLL